MNVGLFLNRDIYSSVALNLLLEDLARHRVSVFLSDNVGTAPEVRGLDLLRLMEQDVPNEHLFPLIASAGELLTFDHIEARHGIACDPMNAPNAPESLDRLRQLELDVVVSIRYGRIFKEAFLQLPKLGVLNLHSGILPDYRGVMATFRALVAGETEIGCTLHYIDDPDIDTGPIVGEWRRPVDRNGSYFGHVLSLYPPGARLIASALETLSNGEALAATPQPREEGAYFSFPDDDDFTRFSREGFELFHASEYRSLLRRYHAG